MPTLARRQDGCYIVRRSHDDEFSTWQVTADGVLFLQRRGVMEGGTFSIWLFVQLKVKNWVYTGDRPASPPPTLSDIEDHELPPELVGAIRDFHTALRTGDTTRATTWIWKTDDSDGDAPTEESNTVVQIESWKRRDCQLWRLPADSGDGFGSVQDFATVTVGLRLRNSDAMDSRLEVKEYWLRTAEGWHVLWNGLPMHHSH